MPHLSPMNWIMAIIMFWTSLTLASTKSWWSHMSMMPFLTPNSNIKNKQLNLWKWNW